MSQLTHPSALFECFQKSDLIHANSLHLIGFEFDGTACFRKGTKLGPNELRKMSPGIETYSPYLDKDLEDYKNLYDLGNLPVGNSSDEEKNWKQASDFFFEITNLQRKGCSS